MGHKDDSSDIYIIDLNSDEITNITNDIFSDSSPSWSPNGKIIYFTSDRGENTMQIICLTLIFLKLIFFNTV